MNNKIHNPERLKESEKVTTIGLFINLILVFAKIATGIFGMSSAMIADGFHSLSDSVSDVFLLFGFRYVNRPPDKTHNYGHGKFETLLTVIVSFIVLATGLAILLNSTFLIVNYLRGEVELTQPNWIALMGALVSIFVKEFLFHLNKQLGLKTNNDALIANAWHHRSDSLSSVASLVGVGLAIILGDKWILLDPIVAVVISFFVLAVGTKMVIKSIKDMLDTSIDNEKEKQIMKTINSVDGVISFHNLKTRKVGNYFAIDVHIEVNRYLNIIQAHDIATEVERKILKNFGYNNMISVHIEPVTTNKA